MGRHRAVERRTLLVGGALGPARYVGRVGALAVALGIGAAVAGGGGTAWADDATGDDQGGTSAGVRSPAADGPGGHVANGGGASHGVKPAKRPPRMQQNNSGGAQTGTTRRSARHDAATADAATADVATDEPGGAAKAPGRTPKRRAATTPEAPVAAPVDTVTPAAPSSDTAEAPPRDDAVTDRHARHRNAEPAHVRVRIPAHDTVTVRRQTATLPADTPRTAPVRTSASTAIRPSVESSLTTPRLTPEPTTFPPARPIAKVVSNLLAAVGITAPSGVGTGDVPKAPMPLVMGVLQLLRRELDHAFPNPAAVAPRSLVTAAAAAVTTQPNAAASAVAAVPTPGDVASTPYGDIGQWMLKPNGEISNYGGAAQDGKPLLEPVNVIIVDTTSTTRAESIRKLNAAMKAAGFPASFPHTTGYQGLINGTVYGQQPTGILQAFSNNGTPQDHGRIFGPAPAENGQGFVWTGAFSTEGPSHGYQSFNDARDDLATALVASGAATSLGDVSMGNGGITGDHDGNAVVLRLDLPVPNAAPTATLKQNKPSGSTGTVTGKVTGKDADRDTLTYTGTTTTSKGTVTVSPTGAFTYTPTAAARHAAAADGAGTAGNTTDTFSITVSDDFGGATAVMVTVDVLPKNAAPSPKITVNKADPIAGTVKGTVAVTDADGDVVTRTASDPKSGAVVFDADGSFTYTPTEAARQLARAKKAVGADTFTVTVDDGHGGVKTVTVKTTIAPTDEAPAFDPAGPTVGAPAASNGSVKGSVSATDPENDAISFSAPKATTYGTVSVSSKGTFTYTPTAAARLAAASNPNLKDTFVITVTDRYGAVTDQSVTVPILPKP
jgi:VCBS repeat-containing protein